MKKIIATMFLGVALYLSPAQAGVFELGGTFNYQHNTYAGDETTSNRGFTANFGYYFTADSEVEFSYQDSTNEEAVPNVQDITYRDRVYSINFLYHLAEEASTFRPYVRTGVGQLNRDSTGWYQGGYKPGGELDQLTVILGVGVKAKLVGRFSLKLEATTYLSGGSISSYKDNVSFNVGGSFYF